MAKLGTIKFESNSGIKEYPVLEPADVNYAAFRVGMPDNTVGVIPLMDIDSSSSGSFRIETPNGLKTIGSLITLEDFEHGFPNPSNMDGGWKPWYNTHDAKLSSSFAMEGDYAVGVISGNPIVHTGINTPRDGAEYLVKTIPYAYGSALIVCSQSIDKPLRDCYTAELDVGGTDEFRIVRYKSEYKSTLARTTYFGGFNITDTTEVTIGLTLDENDLRARLYKPDGTELADISASNTRYTNGLFGLASVRDSWFGEYHDYFDAIQKRIY